MKLFIICFYGFLGVGKIFLGCFIVVLLKCKYVCMLLGGVYDEVEICGYCKIYIGVMLGCIIKSLIKVEFFNLVIILDEIDKLGSDYCGDFSFVMLEVFDFEQNNIFYDNYLDVDYDLFKVMFIVMVNNLSIIFFVLLDCMELIEVSGYIIEEKVEIVCWYFVFKELEVNGIKKEYVKFFKVVLECIVENYICESGVCEFEKKINKVMCKIVLEFVCDGYEVMYEIKFVDVCKYLGMLEYSCDKY